MKVVKCKSKGNASKNDIWKGKFKNLYPLESSKQPLENDSITKVQIRVDTLWIDGAGLIYVFFIHVDIA